MIGRKLGSYEVLSKLGEGGMGEVYRARDAKLDRDVALKVLPEPLMTLITNFFDELRKRFEVMPR